MNPILETLLTIIAATVVGIPTLFILYFGLSILWDRMKPHAPGDMAELLHLYAHETKAKGYPWMDYYGNKAPHPNPYSCTRAMGGLSYDANKRIYSICGNEEWGNNYRVYIPYKDFAKWRNRKYRGFIPTK